METLNKAVVEGGAVVGTMGVPDRAKGAGSRGGKSNTERSRQYRLSKKKSGGMELSIFLSPQSACALQIIRAHGHCTQTSALEDALLRRAKDVVPNVLEVSVLKSKGLISEEDALIWNEYLGN